MRKIIIYETIFAPFPSEYNGDREIVSQDTWEISFDVKEYTLADIAANVSRLGFLEPSSFPVAGNRLWFSVFNQDYCYKTGNSQDLSIFFVGFTPAEVIEIYNLTQK